MATAVMREIDGVHLIFQRYDDLWMIDRVSPDDRADAEEDEEEDDNCIEASTAVSRDEVRGLGALDQRRCAGPRVRESSSWSRLGGGIAGRSWRIPVLHGERTTRGYENNLFGELQAAATLRLPLQPRSAWASAARPASPSRRPLVPGSRRRRAAGADLAPRRSS
jgi:hypothetical protein